MNKLFLFISLLLFFVACNNHQSKDGLLDASQLVNNPKQADGKLSSDTANQPVIHFLESTTHDFGQLHEGEKVQYTFQFTNSGKSPLIINNTETSCGCTASEFVKEPVAPGEKGWVKVTYDSYGRAGSFQKTITVLANTFPNDTKLLIIGDVIPAN